MRKRNLLLASLLLFGGCTPAAKETDAAPSDPQDERLWADELPEEDLPRPVNELGSPGDFIYALDYLAFYRIDDKVTFDFTDEYAKTFFNPYQEFQKAYTQSDLSDVYACNLDDTDYSSKGTVTLKFSISKDLASEAPQIIPDTPIVRSFDDHYEGDPVLVFAIENSGLQKISCENSEQLYYLAQNGYQPVPEKGSIAEEMYEDAKDVLRSRIDDSMSDFEKVKAVYDYLTGEIHYDSETAYSLDTYLVTKQAYYLEGVFSNHDAVCDGRAKAYALMLNMIGIPCVRDTGKSEDGDHAWNYVKLNDRWYLSCTTYGQSDLSDSLGRIFPNYSTLLTNAETPYGEGWGFIPEKHPDISSRVETGPYPFDIYGEMNEALIVEDLGDLKHLMETAKPETDREYKLDFLYTGTDDSFQDQMIDYLSSLEDTNAMEVRTEKGKAYMIVCLK